ADRLLRWGIELRESNYVIRHIPGEANCWADILSRWGAAHDTAASSVAINTIQTTDGSNDGDDYIQSIEQYRVQPLIPDKFVWPDINEIANGQRSHLDTNDDYVTDSNGLFVDGHNRIVIPVQSFDLRIRLCVIAHAGCNSGHIGYHAALQLLKQRFYWIGMEKNMREICNACLHCVATRR